MFFFWQTERGGVMKNSIEVNAMIMEYIHHKRSSNSELPTDEPLTDDYDEDSALAEILNRLRPMLIRRCRHYFGYINEDLMQSGYLELIERMQTYDVQRTEVPVLGYLNRMISCHYFSLRRREGRDSDRLCMIEREVLENIHDPSVEQRDQQENLNDLLSVLSPRERQLVTEHILEKQSLKLVCKRMEISYSYAKKIKQASIWKMKEQYRKSNLI